MAVPMALTFCPNGHRHVPGTVREPALPLSPMNSLGNAMLNQSLLDILVCPVTKGTLRYDRERDELISVSARLAYPVRDGIPVMLEEEARPLDDAEADRWRSV
jgi:uncharacterized protein YbaR (Trm112 family)